METPHSGERNVKISQLHMSHRIGLPKLKYDCLNFKRFTWSLLKNEHKLILV